MQDYHQIRTLPWIISLGIDAMIPSAWAVAKTPNLNSLESNIRHSVRVITLSVTHGAALLDEQLHGWPGQCCWPWVPTGWEYPCTGLGVGGLAIALAAQPTVENLIGGLSLFADKSVRVGDFCRCGSDEGTVEAIGIRSTWIRALTAP